MGNSYNIKGTVRLVGQTKQVNDKFSKRELVLDVPDGKYPQVVCLEASGDRCAALDGLNDGDEVSVDFNIRGREWKPASGDVKFFTTLSVWKIETTKKAEASSGGGYGGTGGTGQDSIPF